MHRDIKPENILLDSQGPRENRRLRHREAARQDPTCEVDLTGTQQVMGTPHYMAPEQMEKPPTVDHRADIYSLGVVFYEMLTGELPLGRFAAPSSRRGDCKLTFALMKSFSARLRRSRRCAINKPARSSRRSKRLPLRQKHRQRQRLCLGSPAEACRRLPLPLSWYCSRSPRFFCRISCPEA